MKKLISVLIAVTFFASSVPAYPAMAQVAANPGGESRQILFPDFSAGLAKTEEEFIGDPKRPAVLFLQDAHTSLEAQKNLSRLIQDWVTKGSVTAVFTEGNKGNVDARGLFQGVPQTAIEKVSQELLRELQFGATEDAHAVSAKPFQLIGLEDLDFYEADLEYFKRSRQASGDLASLLNVLEKAFRDIAPKFMQGEKLRLWQLKQGFEEGKVPLEDYLKYMAENFENGKSSSRLNASYTNLTTVFSLFQTPLDKKELKKKIESLKGDALFKELDIYTEQLFFASETALFLDLYKKLQLLKKLSRLELASEEWRELIEAVPAEHIFWDFLKRHGSKITRPSYSQQTEDYLAPAVHFYELAAARDQKMFENFKIELQKLPPTPHPLSPVIIVAGGFHRQGITQKLKQAGYSYRVVSPLMGNKTNDLDPLYEKRMLSALKEKVLTYYWQPGAQGWYQSEKVKAASLGMINDLLKKMGAAPAVRSAALKGVDDPIRDYFLMVLQNDKNKRLTEQQIVRFLIELFRRYEFRFGFGSQDLTEDDIGYIVTDYFEKQGEISSTLLLLPEGRETDEKMIEHMSYRYFINLLQFFLYGEDWLHEHVKNERMSWRALQETEKLRKWNSRYSYLYDLLPVFVQMILYVPENDPDQKKWDAYLESLIAKNPLMRKAILLFDNQLSQNTSLIRLRKAVPDLKKKIATFSVKLAQNPVSGLEVDKVNRLKDVLLSGESFRITDLAKMLDLSEDQLPDLKRAIQNLGEKRRLTNAPRIPKGKWTSFLEITDASGRPTGIIKDFWALHRGEHEWHRGASAIFVTPDGKWIIQQRRDGGAWDVSTGGHVELNSNPMDMVRAESIEELDFYVTPSRLHMLQHPLTGKNYFRYIYRLKPPKTGFSMESGVFFGETPEGDISDMAIEYLHFIILSEQEAEIFKKANLDSNGPKKPGEHQKRFQGSEEVRGTVLADPEELFAFYDREQKKKSGLRQKFSHNLEAILGAPEIREGVQKQIEQARKEESGAQSLGQTEPVLAQLKWREQGNKRGFENAGNNAELIDWLQGEKDLIEELRGRVEEGNLNDTTKVIGNNDEWHKIATRYAMSHYLERASAEERRNLTVLLPQSPKEEVAFEVKILPDENDPQEIRVEAIAPKMKGKTKIGETRELVVDNNQFISSLSFSERLDYAFRLLKWDLFDIRKHGERANRLRQLIKNWWPESDYGRLLSRGGFSSVMDIEEKVSGRWVLKDKIKEGKTSEEVAQIKYLILEDTLVFTQFNIRQDYRGTYIATGLFMEIINTMSQELAKKKRKLNYVQFLYWAPGYDNFIEHLKDRRLIHDGFISSGGITTYSLDPGLIEDPAFARVTPFYLQALDPKRGFQKNRKYVAVATLDLARSFKKKFKVKEVSAGFLVPQIDSRGELNDRSWISLGQYGKRSSRYQDYHELKGEKRAVVDYLLGRIPKPKSWEAAPDISSPVLITNRLEFAQENPRYHEHGFLEEDKAYYPKYYNRITYFPLRSSRDRGQKLLGLYWVIGDLKASDLRFFSHVTHHAARALELINELEYLSAQTREIRRTFDTLRSVNELIEEMTQASKEARDILAANHIQAGTELGNIKEQVASLEEIVQNLQDIRKIYMRAAATRLPTETVSDTAASNEKLPYGWESQKETLKNLNIWRDILFFAEKDEDVVARLNAFRQLQGISAFMAIADSSFVRSVRNYFMERQFRENDFKQIQQSSQELSAKLKTLCENVPQLYELETLMLALQKEKSGEEAVRVERAYRKLCIVGERLNQFMNPAVTHTDLPGPIQIHDLIREAVASLPNHPHFRFNFASSRGLPLTAVGYRSSVYETVRAVALHLAENQDVTVEIAHSPQENYARIDITGTGLHMSEKDRVYYAAFLQKRAPEDKETTLVIDITNEAETRFSIYVPLDIYAERSFKPPELNGSSKTVFSQLQDKIGIRVAVMIGNLKNVPVSSPANSIKTKALEIERMIQLLDILRNEKVLNRIIFIDYTVRIADKFKNLLLDIPGSDLDASLKSKCLEGGDSAMDDFQRESIIPASFQSRANSLGTMVRNLQEGGRSASQVLDSRERLNLVYSLENAVIKQSAGKLVLEGSTAELMKAALKSLENPRHQVTFVIQDAKLQNDFRRALNDMKDLRRDIRNRISVVSGSLTTEKDFLKFQGLEGRTAFVGSEGALRQVAAFAETQKTGWEVFVAADVLEGGSYRELNEDNLRLKDAYLFSFAMSELARGTQTGKKVYVPSFETFLSGAVQAWLSGFLTAQLTAQAA